MESLESYSLIQFCPFHYYPVEMAERETVLSEFRFPLIVGAHIGNVLSYD
jgi:hypothetical protein